MWTRSIIHLGQSNRHDNGPGILAGLVKLQAGNTIVRMQSLIDTGTETLVNLSITCHLYNGGRLQWISVVGGSVDEEVDFLLPLL